METQGVLLFLLKLMAVLRPWLVEMVNVTFKEDTVLMALKETHVQPPFQKTSSDTDNLDSCHLVSLLVLTGCVMHL